MRIESLPAIPVTAQPPAAAAPSAVEAERSKPPVLRNDYLVLSAEAYRALVQAPRMDAHLAGTFSVSAAGAQGQLSIRPGAGDGFVHVEIDLMHVAQWPEPPGPIRHLQLSAELRGSWVQRAAERDGSGNQATSIAEAVVALAQLPGQRTVSVEALQAADAALEPAAA